MPETIELGNDIARPPSLKLRNVGDYAVVAIIDQAEVPWTEYGSGNVKLSKDGKPRTQEVYTALVVSGTGSVSVNDEDVPCAPGDVVSVYLSGHNRWERVEAYKKLGRRVRVGDVWRWAYARDEPSQAGLNPKKIRTIDARDARPDEAAQTQRCIDLYRERQAEYAPVAPDAARAAYGDEEPF